MKVAVVGAGIVGVSIASYLLRDGHDVVLIDRGEPGDGCSKGNAGALNPGSCIPLSGPGVMSKVPGYLLDPLGPLHIAPRYLLKALPWLLKFAAAGRPQHINPIADALYALHCHTFENLAPLIKNAKCNELVRRSGTLAVYKTDESFAGANKDWKIRAHRHVRQERLSAKDLRDIVPELSDKYRHGILLPDHGFVTNPQGLTQTLAQAFVRDGGRLLRANVEAIKFNESNSVQLTANGEMIETDRGVIAAGAWSARLLKPLGIRLPLETQRGYHVMVADPDINPSLPIISADVKVYATPMEDGLRFAGTVEFAGLDAPPNYKRADALKILAKEMFPNLTVDTVSRWMGHRPCFPDSLPVIGPAPQHPALMLAFGHGHYGLTAASTTARIIAELISGQAPCIDPSPYRIDRF